MRIGGAGEDSRRFVIYLLPATTMSQFERAVSHVRGWRRRHAMRYFLQHVPMPSGTKREMNARLFGHFVRMLEARIAARSEHRSVVYDTLLVAVVAAAMTGCGPQLAGEDSGSRSASASDVPLAWRYSEEPSSVDGGSEPIAILSGLHPGLIAADGGHYFVFDPVAGQVKRYDVDGRATMRIGRMGRGPEEFATPVALGTDRRGSLLVFDLAKRALVHFDSAGRHVGEIRVEGVYGGGPIVVSGPDVVLALLSIDRKARGLRSELVRVKPSGRTLLLTSLEPLPKGMAIQGCPGLMPLRRRFVPRLIWDGSEERIVATSDARYVLSVWRHGEHVFNFGRAIAPPRVGSDSAKLDVSQDPLLRGLGETCGRNAAAAVEEIGYEKVAQLVEAVTLSPDGEFWVTRRFGGGRRVDVFDSLGAYRGTLPDDWPPVSRFVDSGRFLSLVETDSGQVLRLYSIQRQ